MLPKTEPLSRFPSCRSTDLDEARSLIFERFGLDPMKVAQKSRRARVRINCVYLPSLYLSYVQYGASVTVRLPQPDDRYMLLLPLTGQVESCVGTESVLCDSRRAALTSPTQLWTTHSDAQSTRMNLSIRQEALVGRLAALLGDAPRKPPVFRRDLDLSRGPGRSLASFLAWTIGELDRDDGLLDHPLMSCQFEDWVLTALLTRQPHSYSEALEKGGDALPRDVKRAVDYIHAHADQAITIEDLVSISGVAGRTLHRHFRDFTGRSPMAYLRKVRFARVRAELQEAGPKGSVTRLAMKWGFSHCGRFSVEYRQIFGESPSETAGKRRPR